MPSNRAPVLKSVTPDAESADQVEPDSIDPLEPEPKIEKAPLPRVPPAPGSAATVPFRRLRRLAKLVFALALLAGIGFGGYLGWPAVRERYIQPVEATATDVTVLQERLEETLTRIDVLENELAAAQNATVVQGDAITELQATTESLLAQDGVLTGQFEAVESSLDQANRVAVDQEVTMVAAQYLGRARLFLYQANYGLAEQDIAAALESLVQVPTDAQNTEVIERLTAAAEALPDRPVLAADELDIAWGALLDGTVE